MTEDKYVHEAISMHMKHLNSSVEIQKRLRTIVWRQREILKRIGYVKGSNHRINLIPVTDPVAVTIRLRSPSEKELEKKIVERFLEHGIMEHCESPWSFEHISVPKNDGETMRYATDSININSITTTNSYQMQSMMETID